MRKYAPIADMKISNTDMALSISGNPASAIKIKFTQLTGSMSEKGVNRRFFESDVPSNTKCAVKMRIRHAMYLSELTRLIIEKYPSIAPHSPHKAPLFAPSAAAAQSPNGADIPKMIPRAKRKEAMPFSGYVRSDGVMCFVSESKKERGRVCSSFVFLMSIVKNCPFVVYALLYESIYKKAGINAREMYGERRRENAENKIWRKKSGIESEKAVKNSLSAIEKIVNRQSV